eukprot:3461845-Rhodomonas_salina.1
MSTSSALMPDSSAATSVLNTDCAASSKASSDMPSSVDEALSTQPHTFFPLHTNSPRQPRAW